ncbi:MFS transporter [Streptomyces sp. ADMS]|uniref:MFS transporter n=1 Tax=Streptomyces sp. ADMS TaxID=3071415 RepID=UPI00296E9709|nr:MFS transporter [Streptomyces sp. ADMS]MDW4910074.1 MFS transporter [Streptomyces sp. ADMS]
MTARTEGTAPAPRGQAGVTGDSRRGGLPAVISVALGSFVLVLSELLPVGALTDIGADLDVSTGVTGLLVVTPGLAAAVAAPVLTLTAGRLDRRTVLWTLAALTAVANLLCAVSQNLATMLAGRVLLGAALGGFWAVGAAVAPRLVPPESAHRAASLVTAGISVGTVASLPLAALAGGSTGWRTAFWAASLVALGALAAQLRYLPPLPAGPVIGRRALAAVLRSPAARGGLLTTALVFLGHFAAYTYVGPYLERQADFGGPAIAAVLLAYGVAGIGGNFLAGLTLARSVRGTVGGAAAALAAAVALLPVCAGSPVLVSVLVVVWGAAFGMVPLSLQTAMAKAVPEAPESSLAVFVTAVQLSLATGSLLGGLVVDGYGVPAGPVLGAALAALAVTVPLLSARRSRTRQQESVV